MLSIRAKDKGNEKEIGSLIFGKLEEAEPEYKKKKFFKTGKMFKYKMQIAYAHIDQRWLSLPGSEEALDVQAFELTYSIQGEERPPHSERE